MEKDIKLIISTHQGKLFDEVCDYVLVKSKKGEFGILPNHVATITTLEEGFLKFVRDKKELYLCVYNSVLEFSNNVLTVLAQEAHIGETMDSARSYLDEVRKDRLEKNRQTEAEIATGERELMENIKKAKAGNL